MDVAQAIEKRRSIRQFRPDPIPEEVLNKLLNLMRLAPSGSNRQPWKFIVVRDKEIREQVAALCRFISLPSGRKLTQDWIAGAPVIIVACGSERKAGAGYYKDGEFCIATGQVLEEEAGKNPGEYQSCVSWDLAIALDHLALAAVQEKLGTCWIGGMNAPALRELLSIPDDILAMAVMPVGYSVSWPDPRPRKPLEEIVCYDRYS